MTNFDFLTSDPQFDTFSSGAVSAEKILYVDTSASVLNCRWLSLLCVSNRS